jgi:hypothetical protein
MPGMRSRTALAPNLRPPKPFAPRPATGMFVLVTILPQEIKAVTLPVNVVAI